MLQIPSEDEIAQSVGCAGCVCRDTVALVAAYAVQGILSLGAEGEGWVSELSGHAVLNEWVWLRAGRTRASPAVYCRPLPVFPRCTVLCVGGDCGAAFLRSWLCPLRFPQLLHVYLMARPSAELIAMLRCWEHRPTARDGRTSSSGLTVHVFQGWWSLVVLHADSRERRGFRKLVSNRKLACVLRNLAQEPPLTGPCRGRAR